jgi:hypothetical protein
MSDTSLVQRIDVNALVQHAIEGKASVETLERLFALSKEVRAEQARAAWHVAMAAFQAEAPEITKEKIAKVITRTGGTYSYKYAPLDRIIPLVRPILAKHGLSVTFETTTTHDLVSARCIVGHIEGHVQACDFSVPIDLESKMNPAQQVASASTYARRYAYLAALGLAPEDDDDGAQAGPIVQPKTIDVEGKVVEHDPFDAPVAPKPVPVSQPSKDAKPEPKRIAVKAFTGRDTKTSKAGTPYWRIQFANEDGTEETLTTFSSTAADEAMIAWDAGMGGFLELAPTWDKKNNSWGWIIEAVDRDEPPF